MLDAKLISFCDAAQTAIREILEERGYDCVVSLSTEEGTGLMKTSIKALKTNKKSITAEIVNSIVQEATERVLGDGVEDSDIFFKVIDKSKRS